VYRFNVEAGEARQSAASRPGCADANRRISVLLGKSLREVRERACHMHHNLSLYPYVLVQLISLSAKISTRHHHHRAVLL